jgi:hypothetical protein
LIIKTFLNSRLAKEDKITFVASCFLGAFPPVDLRAVCLVRAMITLQKRHWLAILSTKDYRFLQKKSKLSIRIMQMAKQNSDGIIP